jgi:hypothetical protein
MPHLAPALALALALAAPRVAAADPPPPRDRFRERPQVLSGVLGAGAPTGILGVEYEHALLPWLALAGGAGVGAVSPQASAMTRVRAVGERFAAGGGFGASYGGARIENFDVLGPGSHDVLRGAVWLNSSLFLERRTETGALFRLEAGAGRSIRTASCQHVEEAGTGLYGTYEEEQVRPCSEDQALRVLPFVAFAVGQSF